MSEHERLMHRHANPADAEPAQADAGRRLHLPRPAGCCARCSGACRWAEPVLQPPLQWLPPPPAEAEDQVLSATYVAARAEQIRLRVMEIVERALVTGGSNHRLALLADRDPVSGGG